MTTENITHLPIPITLPGPPPIFSISFPPLLPPPSPFLQTTLPQIYKLTTTHPFKPDPPYYIQNQFPLKSPTSIFPFSLILTFALIFNTLQTNT
ncbi:alanine:cation symporter family protein, partial [Bacillus altitudinis]|uniref:alanine:cation symporter family protein n=1 Tax=Bacillus altitudinis TaxID=293387 RepID=UPI003B52AA68